MTAADVAYLYMAFNCVRSSSDIATGGVAGRCSFPGLFGLRGDVAAAGLGASDHSPPYCGATDRPQPGTAGTEEGVGAAGAVLRVLGLEGLPACGLIAALTCRMA